jgi:putative peptide zinc metalloprotease protein
MNRYQQLTVVPDTDGFVVGRRGSQEFVAVPEIGGLVIRWLQDGVSVAGCAAKASQFAGEDVDVEEFLDDLTAAGILSDGPPAAVPRGHRVGALLFGPVGVTALGLLAGVGLVLMLFDARLRPVYQDGLPGSTPLASLLIIAALASALTVVHEFAHKLAAARLGVYGRISLGRRLYFVVAQTDLTGLWAVERRRRIVPLLAGMLVEAAIAGVMLLVQVVFVDHEMLRAVIFLVIGGLVAQTAIYIRTDLYALILVVTGCQNLWATKGALARRIIRRQAAGDLEVLATASRREIIWAWIYLAWYLPGVLIATWYLVVFTLPVTISLVTMSAESIVTGSLFAAAGGVVALALAVVPLTVGVIGAGRSAAGVIRRGLRGERAGDQRSPRIQAS